MECSGKSRAYIYKLMKLGQLSFEKVADGSRLLELDDLLTLLSTPKSTVHSPHGQPKILEDSMDDLFREQNEVLDGQAMRLQAAQEQIALLERLLSERETRISEIKQLHAEQIKAVEEKYAEKLGKQDQRILLMESSLSALSLAVGRLQYQPQQATEARTYTEPEPTVQEPVDVTPVKEEQEVQEEHSDTIRESIASLKRKLDKQEKQDKSKKDGKKGKKR